MPSPRPPTPPAANDNASAARMVPLIGILHVDEGRLERFDVPRLIPMPAAWPTHGLQES